VQDAHEAVALDPTSALALAAELLARGLEPFVVEITNLFTHADLKVDSAQARQVADLAQQKFPNLLVVRRERAVLFQLVGDPRSAKREIDVAISLDLSSGRNFVMRATFRAEGANCPGANDDLKQAPST
jgi:hypothetical protein